MKQVLFVLSLCLISSIGFSQNSIEDIFEKYSGEEDVVHLKMNGSIFDSEKSDKYGSEIDFIELLILPAGSGEAKADMKKLSKLAKKANYETLMAINSEDDQVDIYSMGSNGVYDSLILSVSGDDETVLIKLDGKILQSDIDDLDFDGDKMNFLEQLKK